MSTAPHASVIAAGCTHFIIGRDMAGSKSSVTGDDFYGAYDAQDTAAKHAEELHMQTVPSLNITYTEVMSQPSTADFVCTSMVLFKPQPLYMHKNCMPQGQ